MEGKYLTLLLVLITVLILLLMASLALMAWFLFKSPKKSPTVPLIPTSHPLPKNGEEARCPNHPDQPVSGKCALCEKSFCKKCLFSQNGPVFCRKHLNLYLCTTWSEIGEVKTNAMTPHTAEHIYQTKKNLLKEGEIPSFILTNYKINTETDTIESYVCLCVPEKNREQVLKTLRRKLDTNSSFPS